MKALEIAGWCLLAVGMSLAMDLTVIGVSVLLARHRAQAARKEWWRGHGAR